MSTKRFSLRQLKGKLTQPFHRSRSRSPAPLSSLPPATAATAQSTAASSSAGAGATNGPAAPASARPVSPASSPVPSQNAAAQTQAPGGSGGGGGGGVASTSPGSQNTATQAQAQPQAQPVSSPGGVPSPPTTSAPTTSTPATSTLLTTPSNNDSLWTRAAKQLSTKELTTLSAFINVQSGGGQVQVTVSSLESIRDGTQQLIQANAGRHWTIRWGREEIVLRDIGMKILQWIDKFKAIGDTVVQYDPGHAALPWAAFRFLLQVRLASAPTQVPR